MMWLGLALAGASVMIVTVVLDWLDERARRRMDDKIARWWDEENRR